MHDVELKLSRVLSRVLLHVHLLVLLHVLLPVLSHVHLLRLLACSLARSLACSLPAETYIEPLVSSDADSTMATENGGTSSDSGSVEDEDGDALIQLTQNVRLSQKMAFEVSSLSFSSDFMTEDFSRGFFGLVQLM